MLYNGEAQMFIFVSLIRGVCWLAAGIFVGVRGIKDLIARNVRERRKRKK
jgi:hypothetical protein